MTRKSVRQRNKYALYERSVQSPETHAEWFARIYHELNGYYPCVMREDFCGTFKLSAEWVKRNHHNAAIAVDLDPAPLRYGLNRHWKRLSQDQQRRLLLLRHDVRRLRKPRVQLIVACNFSFFIFKKREELLRYFRSCRASLEKNGVLLLELAGGPGMIEPIRERSFKKTASGEAFTYIWHQQSFDPITHDAKYAIDFKFRDGTALREAFTYDWRLWTLPEVRDVLESAGFEWSSVYWETRHKGRATGEYTLTEKGDNAWAWIAYVVAKK